MLYQTIDPQGNKTYREGRINLGTGTPDGNFRYKIERDLSTNNRWCGYVNTSATYCITLPITGNYNYNAAGAVTVGIESADTSHTFTDGTKTENIWYYPFGGTGYVRVGSMTKEDNMNASLRPWYSTYTPYVSGSTDSVTFRNKTL